MDDDEDGASLTVSISGRIAERDADDDVDNLDSPSPGANVEYISGSLRVSKAVPHKTREETPKDMDLLPNIELEGVAHRWKRATSTGGICTSQTQLTPQDTDRWTQVLETF